MNKNFGLLISLFAIIIAFFLGYSYAYRVYIIETEINNNSIDYIDISSTTRNITIKSAPDNIRFRVNGELFHTGSVNLK